MKAINQAMVVKMILTLACLKLLKKKSKFKKSNLLLIPILIPLSGVKPSVVVDKHGISHRGLMEMMSVVVSSGSGNINDLFLSKIQCIES